MQVAQVLGYLAARYGGPSRVALRLGQALESRGVVISWWATATVEEQQELASLGAHARLFPRTHPSSWYRSPALSHALQKHIKELDLLHLHQVWDYPLYAAAQSAQQAGKPYLVTPHGIFSQPWRYASLKKRVYLRWIARPFMNRAACIQAVTPAELEGFHKIGIRVPYVVIPNGIDQDEFADLPLPGEADDYWPVLRGRRVMLFLGRLSPEKGLDQLVPAWKQVVQEYPDAILVIAGPDHRGYRATVEALVERHGIADKVLLPGMLVGKEKLLALRRADIYTQPSYSEGFSMAVLEALACGKPCLITPGCNFGEMAEVGAGEVVEPCTDALATGLAKLLSRSSTERQEMGNRGRNLVLAKYTWDIVARKMLTVYHCILNQESIPLYPEPSD
jgi:glycosyltransferase involved in cell wall biosynthesis